MYISLKQHIYSIPFLILVITLVSFCQRVHLFLISSHSFFKSSKKAIWGIRLNQHHYSMHLLFQMKHLYDIITILFSSTSSSNHHIPCLRSVHHPLLLPMSIPSLLKKKMHSVNNILISTCIVSPSFVLFLWKKLKVMTIF